MPQKPYILVTGAAGMIGSGIVRTLNDQGRQNLILVDDLKQTAKWKNLVGKRFINLISRHKIFEWLEGREGEVEAIFHLGACSDTMETNGDYLLENNFRFTIRLAEWALNQNIRFIYASSAATYGNGAQGFSDQEEAILELRPINMYAFSKQLVDLWMLREKVFNRVVGLKYFNVFGPNEYHKGRMASMVLKMTHKAQTEGVIGLYKSNDLANFSDGEQRRDFIYLKDAAKWTCALLDPKYRQVNGIFNVGLGIATTWNFLARALFQALGKETNIQYIEMPPGLHSQYQNYTCADMSKLHKIFAEDQMMRQTTPIEAAVNEYVRDYLLKDAHW